jgi:hypothetical protein
VYARCEFGRDNFQERSTANSHRRFNGRPGGSATAHKRKIAPLLLCATCHGRFSGTGSNSHTTHSSSGWPRSSPDFPENWYWTVALAENSP